MDDDLVKLAFVFREARALENIPLHLRKRIFASW